MKQALIDIINNIPHGKVVSYGSVAQQVNIRTDKAISGWGVGRLLSSMSVRDWKYEQTIPRRRVVNKQGVVSSLKLGEKGIIQVKLLESESIEVTNGQVDMKKYEWKF